MHESRLREAGLRVTRPRVAVLEVLAAANAQHEHLPAAEVADRARRMLGSLSTQAVYDCLDALTAVRLVRRIEPALARPLRGPGRRQAEVVFWATCPRCSRSEHATTPPIRPITRKELQVR